MISKKPEYGSWHDGFRKARLDNHAFQLGKISGVTWPHSKVNFYTHVIYGTLLATPYYSTRIFCIHATVNCSSAFLSFTAVATHFPVRHSTRKLGIQLYCLPSHALFTAPPLLRHVSCFSYSAVSILLSPSCSNYLLSFSCSFALFFSLASPF